jgi:hypothetical protein
VPESEADRAEAVGTAEALWTIWEADLSNPGNTTQLESGQSGPAFMAWVRRQIVPIGPSGGVIEPIGGACSSGRNSLTLDRGGRYCCETGSSLLGGRFYA